MSRRFTKMTARYFGKCANCGEKLCQGDQIYYSRPDAYCNGCGENIFESQPEEPKHYPMPVAAEPGDEVEAVQPPSSTPVKGGKWVLTTQKCYCDLVKRKCGVCVANEMA